MDGIFNKRYKFILTIETIVKATAAAVATNVVRLSSSGVSWDEISHELRSVRSKHPSMETRTKHNCALLKCVKYLVENL